MSGKKETLVLLFAALISIGFLLGGVGLLGLFLMNFLRPPNSTNSNPDKPNVAFTEAPVAITSNTVNKCNVPNLPKGTFTYGGSTTWAPIRRDVDSVLTKNCPQFGLVYYNPPNKKPGSGTGIELLIDNLLSFSQSSRSVKGEENQKALQKGLNLKEIPVAIDGIAVAVNPNLNISGLTVAQLKDIYTGKITNWKQVGGSDLAITAYTRTKEAGGTVEFFVENVLNKEDFASNVIYIGTTTEALRKLARNPGGIYYASAPEVVPQCSVKSLAIGNDASKLVLPYQEPLVSGSQCAVQPNKLNSNAFRRGDYPITRKLFVIVKLNGQNDQQAGEAYANWLLTPQAQDLIEKAGFVRLQ
ncbi:MAG: substrate-binding domain-containing protein [Scytonematopsis contorta HA4267-MV1]|jgi:phosphate transport system substrate-binding protein|nr:substrate-binding domain-containing protein [Scytonematopsis contorta HA4267-MV1]